MKKRIIISIGIILAVAATVIGANYLLSFRTIGFSIEAGTSIAVYSSEDKLIKELPTRGNLSLREGEYYLIPSGENIASDKIAFTVGDSDSSIEVTPPYNRAYLDTLLQTELPKIGSAVAAKYPTLISGYELQSGKLYERGEWYGGLLKPKVSDIRDQRDPYRIVLHKVDDRWEVVRRPEYILSSSRFDQVPIAILRDVNSLVE
jgi:hypothetical protein